MLEGQGASSGEDRHKIIIYTSNEGTVAVYVIKVFLCLVRPLGLNAGRCWFISEI